MSLRSVRRANSQIHQFANSRISQNDLADVFARLHPAMGVGGFGEWEGAIDDRSDASRGEQGPDVRFELACEGPFSSTVRARSVDPVIVSRR